MAYNDFTMTDDYSFRKEAGGSEIFRPSTTRVQELLNGAAEGISAPK
jgi:hypothetical protein